MLDVVCGVRSCFSPSTGHTVLSQDSREKDLVTDPSPSPFFSYFFLSLTRYLCGDRLCTPVHLHLQKAPLSKGALMNGSLIVRKHWWVQGKLVIKAHASAECTHCFSRSPINFTLKVIIDSVQRFCEIFSSTAQRENSQGHFFQFYLEMMYTVCFN